MRLGILYLAGGGSTHHKVMGGDYKQIASGKLVFRLRFVCNLTMLLLAALLPPPARYRIPSRNSKGFQHEIQIVQTHENMKKNPMQL